MHSRELERARSVAPKGRSTALVFAIGVVVMLAITFGLRLVERGELLSHRVAVGVRGCGPECARLLESALVQSLSRLGFDASVPRGQAPDLFDDPQAARAFARSHGARFAVMLSIAIKDNSAVPDGVGHRIGADTALYVLDAAHDDAPRPADTLHSLVEADDERVALMQISRRIVQSMFPVAASVLLASDGVRAMKLRTIGLQQQAAALALNTHQRDVDARTLAMREYERYCAANSASLAALDGERCVSGGCVEEIPVGLLGDGSAIVLDHGARASFPLDPSSTLRRLLTSERLWLVPRRGARKLLAEAANFAANPELARDGRTLAFIEERREQQRLYVLDPSTLERRSIASVRAPDRLRMPRLSPDGARVVYSVLDGQLGRSALMLADTRGNTAPRKLLSHIVEARWTRLALGADAVPRLLIAALVPFETSTEMTLVVFDPDSGEAVAHETLNAHAVRSLGDGWPAGATPDTGELLLSWSDDGACGFARYRPTQPVEWTSTDLCPTHITAGTRGVFADALVGGAHGERQVVRVDVQSGKLELVTEGAAGAEYPKLAATGDGLAYLRALPQRYGELQPSAVCIDERGRDDVLTK